MTFVRFGLIVTGQGEARFLPELFKLFHRLPSRPACTFEVLRKIGQRSQRSVRYCRAFDCALTAPAVRRRAAVFFFVMMLEAYYFGDPDMLRDELEITELPPHLCDLDVETIRHPKNELKLLVPGFDEIEHGERLVRRLDLRKVLAHPERSAALRTLFAWCARALGIGWGDGTGLSEGTLCPVTKSQLQGRPPASDRLG